MFQFVLISNLFVGCGASLGMTFKLEPAPDGCVHDNMPKHCHEVPMTLAELFPLMKDLNLKMNKRSEMVLGHTHNLELQMTAKDGLVYKTCDGKEMCDGDHPKLLSPP